MQDERNRSVDFLDASSIFPASTRELTRSSTSGETVNAREPFSARERAAAQGTAGSTV